LDQLTLAITEFVSLVRRVPRHDLRVHLHPMGTVRGSPALMAIPEWPADDRALIEVLVTLHPDDVVLGEKAPDLVPRVVEQVVSHDSLDDHLAGLAVLGPDQTIVTRYDDVIHLVSVFVDHLLDPGECDGKVVVFEADEKDVLSDDVVVEVLGSHEVVGIPWDEVLHEVDPLDGPRPTVLVVAHEGKKFDATVTELGRDGGPLQELAGGSVVGQVADRNDDVDALRLELLEDRAHRMARDGVAATLRIGKDADPQAPTRPNGLLGFRLRIFGLDRILPLDGLPPALG